MPGKNKSQSVKSNTSSEGNASDDNGSVKAQAEKRVYRIAVRVNEIINVESVSKKGAIEYLKKRKLGNLINRENISFLG